MKNFRILLLFASIGLLLLAGMYRPFAQTMSRNCVSFCGRFGFKDTLLLAEVLTEMFSMPQVVKTYLKMSKASV
jgi:hypothetical protein